MFLKWVGLKSQVCFGDEVVAGGCSIAAVHICQLQIQSCSIQKNLRAQEFSSNPFQSPRLHLTNHDLDSSFAQCTRSLNPCRNSQSLVSNTIPVTSLLFGRVQGSLLAPNNCTFRSCVELKSTPGGGRPDGAKNQVGPSGLTRMDRALTAFNQQRHPFAISTLDRVCFISRIQR